MTAPPHMDVQLGVAAETVHPGQIIFRQTLRDIPDTNKFECEVVVADIAEPLDVRLDDDGVPAIAFNQYVRKNVHGLYRASPTDRPLNLPTLEYGKLLRLPNLISDVCEIETKVAALVDTAQYRDAGAEWSATIIGFTLLRSLARELYVHTGQSEIDKPPTDVDMTDPQKRATAVEYVIERALDDFLVMPPTQTS